MSSGMVKFYINCYFEPLLREHK